MVRRDTHQLGDYKLGQHQGKWIARWQEAGKKRQCELGLATRDTPRSLAIGAFTKWVRQREAALQEDQHFTIGQLAGMYIKYKELEKKPSVPRMRDNWVALRNTFEHLQPADVATPYEVEGEMRTRCHAYAVMRAGNGIARDTIATELNFLRTVLKWAATHKHIKEAPHVWVNKAGKSRETQIKDLSALTTLLESASGHIRILLMLALFTGARRGACCDLTWDRVNFEDNTIDFRIDDMDSEDILNSGHRKGRALVDMHPVLHLALRDAKEYARTDYVVEFRGKPIKDPTGGVREAFKKAGLYTRFVGLHALRKTLATVAAGKGVDMRQIQKMLGHDRIETTQRLYAKHLPGYTLPVAEALQLGGENSEL